MTMPFCGTPPHSSRLSTERELHIPSWKWPFLYSSIKILLTSSFNTSNASCSPMASWDDILFIHILLVPYMTPPDVVCLIFTSRECKKVFDTADSWRAVTKACFGPLGGSRGHLPRRLRRKKVVWWVSSYNKPFYAVVILADLSSEPSFEQPRPEPLVSVSSSSLTSEYLWEVPVRDYQY